MSDRSPERRIAHLPRRREIARSRLTAFMRFCAHRTNRAFPDQAGFHDFSVRNFRQFWRLFLEWSAIVCEGAAEPVCTDDACERAVFFPDLRLSYVENLLAGNDDAAALTAIHANGRPTDHFTRGALRERVARAAAGLRGLGVGPEDHVVAILNNNAEAVIACLAVLAVGAGFSSAAPDMGAAAILSRFAQLDPKLLVWEPDGGRLDAQLPDLVRALPTLAAAILADPLPSFPQRREPAFHTADARWRWHDGAGTSGLTVHRLSDLIASAPAPLAPFPRFPFNHRLFTMFSSGTTGRPKCIVHGAGGTLLEHMKEHLLHGDVRPGETMFFQTSCAWMMWNWQLSALAAGARLVLFDGVVAGPGTLWEIVAGQKVNLFGSSPAYLKLCERSDYRPSGRFPALRAIYSTGSVLYDEQFDWVARAIKDVPLQSISGGTDIIGCFVLGSPNLPVWRGEAQCRSLGLDVQALAQPGAPYGELVCRNPFPSRPLGFHGDPDGARFHAAYFGQNEGVWTHGDFISFAPEGTARLHGRSDGTMNIRGIRIGPAEIYAALQSLPEIGDAMAVEQATPSEPGGSRIVLLVVLRPDARLNGDLARRIRMEIGRACSPAHVPAVIADVAALPTTHSGKRSESAARAAVNGLAVANAEALSNPECLEDIIRHPALQAPAPRPATDAEGGTLEEALQAIWQDVFGFTPIARGDDFFDLGGNSLLAMAIFARVRERFGRDLPIITLLAAPTIASLASILRARAESGFSCIVPVIPGEGRRLFLVHGLSGTVLELAHLLRAMRGGPPVSVLQARGLDCVSAPHTTVEAMASHYVEAIRAVQPHGPYSIAGYSFGGLVAYEMARQLAAAGEAVAFLGLIDTAVSSLCLTGAEARDYARHRFADFRRALRAAPRRAIHHELTHMTDALLVRLGRRPPQRDPLLRQLPPPLRSVRRACEQAFATYRPRPYPGRVHYFRATERDPRRCDEQQVWQRMARLEIVPVPGAHLALIRPPLTNDLAAALRRTNEVRTADADASSGRADVPATAAARIGIVL